MFISNKEKAQLFTQLNNALKELTIATTEIIVLKGKVKSLEGNVYVLKQIVDYNKTPKRTPQKTKPRKTLTPEQKEKQRQYMQKYLAKKKAEKLAQVKK